jgi:predicted HicB family RNase H-like nuclease
MDVSPNKLEYRGFIGEFTYDEDADLFEGSVLISEELLLFQGKSIKDLYTDFKEAVDDYLAWYDKRDVQANKAGPS